MTLQLQRMTRYAVAAIAVAALAATPAGANDDLRSPDTRDAALAVQEDAAKGDLRSPDARDAADAARAAASTPLAAEVGSPDARDWAGHALPPADVTQIMVRRPGGFDWSDAGIGAAGGIGLVLLLAGTWLLVRHGRHEPRLA